MNRPTDKPVFRQAYTIVEALVSSSILLIGISAAASMSLTLLTQEEINERSVKVFNHLDNAARLYQLGVPVSEIEAILPEEPALTSLSDSSSTVTVAGIGDIDVHTLTVTYKPNAASVKNNPSKEEWTGGDDTTTRSASVSVFRADSFMPENLPRVQKFGP